MPSNAADLFDTALNLGELSQDSVGLLDPLQTEINAALAQGTKKRAARVTLCSLWLDNSTSMNFRKGRNAASNWEIACEGHDLFFRALVGSKAAKQILCSSGFMIPFNGNNGLHFPFRDLVLPDHTVKAPKPNFVPLRPTDAQLFGETPLCSMMLRVFGAVQAQATDYTRDGCDVFTITVILSDGGNNEVDHNPDEVATLSGDMRRQERHKMYFAGIDDGYTDYHKFGADCGLDPNLVKALPNDEHEIRAWLEQVSQSAVAGSEAADIDSFSKVTLGTAAL